AGSAVTVLHVVRPDRPADGGGASAKASAAVSRAFPEPGQGTAVEFRVVRDADPVEAVLREAGGFDLMIVGADEEWGLASHRFGLRPERLAAAVGCSLLLVRKADPAPGDEDEERADAPAASGDGAASRAAEDGPATVAAAPAPVGAGA
ncbi:MAG: sodium/hydrogen exchanger, partial [Phycisphaerales bacterium]|nr:sodium/hydrogen exchanger [Phycisphaerales bacterium]